MAFLVHEQVIHYCTPYKNKKPYKSKTYRAISVLEAGLEPAQPQWPRDFKSLVSTDSTIRASFQRKSGKRDSNSRP